MGTSSTTAGRERGEAEGFVDFFRRYTKTWIHGVSTAGLTGFGMLTFVHRWFAALAIASYVLPPLGLYLARERQPAHSVAMGSEPTDEPSARSDDGDRGRSSRSSDADRRASALEDAPEGAPSTSRAESTEVGDGRSRMDAESIDRGDTTAGGDSDPNAGQEPRWTPVDSPTDAALFDVALTGEGAVAVGVDGVAIAGDGDGWTAALEDGPGANAETLYGVDCTPDGGIVWTAGDNGAVGRLEADTGRHVDHSAPNGLTDNLTGVAVSGTEGDETVLLINGSGEVLRGRYRDGDLAWAEPVTPGSGSSLSDVALTDGVGYCCDTNDGVFFTEDGGRTFDRVGLEGGDGTLTALAPAAPDDCLVATDGGGVHRYDGSAWTPERVGEAALTDIDRIGGRIAACDDSGGVYDRADPAADWRRVATSAPGSLRGVALEDGRGVVVGDEGTVLERC